MTALKWITSKAKNLRTTQPNMSWKMAIKIASRQYNLTKKTGGKLSGKKRKPAKRRQSSLRGAKRRSKQVGAVRRKPAKRSGRKPVALSKRAAIELSLGKAYVRYIKADTVKATKAASRTKTALIKKLKSL